MSKQTAAANAARRRNPRNHEKKLFQLVADPKIIEGFGELDPRERGDLVATYLTHRTILSLKIGPYRLALAAIRKEGHQ